MFQSIKNRAVLIALALGAASMLACAGTGGAAPDATLTAEPPVEATAVSTDVPTEAAAPGGVSMTFDAAVASGWTMEIVPASDPNSGAPEPWLLPEHRAFTLTDYALGDTFHAPTVYVFRIADFEGLNSHAVDEIARMQAFLQSQPPINQTGTMPEDNIPFLPVFNAAQVFRAQVRYMPFQNGTGVRFVTQYDQAPIPINNHELFYTYQGITGDGLYYVAAILPISHPSLPADGTVEDGDAFMATFEAYMQETVTALDTADPASFIPDLNVLDAMMGSLKVGPEE
jgi:hypothetical protein